MSGRSSKENDILALTRKPGDLCRNAENSFTPVAEHGVPQSFGCDEGDLTLIAFVATANRDSNKRAVGSLPALKDLPELCLRLDGPHEPTLDSDLLAPLGTTTGKNVATTLGGHASTETVALSTLPLVRLIRTLHLIPPGNTENAYCSKSLKIVRVFLAFCQFNEEKHIHIRRNTTSRKPVVKEKALSWCSLSFTEYSFH